MKRITWDPKEDITAWELAQALRPLRGLVHRKTLEALPGGARRHWQEEACPPPEARNPGQLEKVRRALFGRIASLFSFRLRRAAPAKGNSPRYGEHLAAIRSAKAAEPR